MVLMKRAATSLALIVMMTGCQQKPVEQAAATATPAVMPVSGGISASTNAPADAATAEQKIKQVLAASGIQAMSIQPSPIAGLYQVEIGNMRYVYASADASYLIAGDLYKNGGNGMENVSETSRGSIRAKMIAEVPESDLIIFAPTTGKPVKGVITVFTDVDCFYCQKLHKDVPRLNELGIAVHYMAYPRAGVGSPTYRKLVTAWCADNKQDALTRLKNKESVAENLCDPNPVAKQFEVGQKLGVNGTPALFLQDGTMLPGYLPPERLMKEMGINPQG